MAVQAWARRYGSCVYRNRASRPDLVTLLGRRSQHGHRQADGTDVHDRRQVAQALPGTRPGVAD